MIACPFRNNNKSPLPFFFVSLYLLLGTDGGRIAFALLGRNITKLINGITLITLFIAGLGSDLFLLHFLFVFLFQGEPEIPLRNELEEVGPLRVLLSLATAAFVIMTLVPIS